MYTGPHRHGVGFLILGRGQRELRHRQAAAVEQRHQHVILRDGQPVFVVGAVLVFAVRVVSAATTGPVVMRVFPVRVIPAAAVVVMMALVPLAAAAVVMALVGVVIVVVAGIFFVHVVPPEMFTPAGVRQ